MEHEEKTQGVCKPDGCCGKCGEDGTCPCKDGAAEKTEGCGGACSRKE